MVVRIYRTYFFGKRKYSCANVSVFCRKALLIEHRNKYNPCANTSEQGSVFIFNFVSEIASVRCFKKQSGYHNLAASTAEL